jgi:hypothetical protein
MSYARMSEDEQRLEAEIAALLQRAEDADVSDDARFGAGQHEEDLPEELRRRRDRLDKIRAAKHALEQEALRVRADALRAQSEGQRAKAEAEANPVELGRSAKMVHPCSDRVVHIENAICEVGWAGATSTAPLSPRVSVSSEVRVGAGRRS